MTFKREIILDNLDSSFSTEAAFLYQCIWLLDDDVLRVSILGVEEKKILKMESYDLSETPIAQRKGLLSELIKNHHKYLDNSVLNQFIHVNSNFTLVPHVFNERNTYPKIYRGLLDSDTENYTTRIQHLDIDLITFHPFASVLSAGHFNIHHFIGKLIEYCSAQYASSHENLAVAYELKGSTFIVLFRNERLIVANQYEIKTPADVAYFVFASMKSYEMNPGCTALYVGGELQDSDTLIGTFNKYVREVFIMKPNHEYTGVPEDKTLVLTTDICSL